MLTLVDTSVWIGHFHKSDKRLVELLESSQVLVHPAIIGEVAAGNLKNRSKILGDLKLIPEANEVSSQEVLEFLEMRKLFGKGLSWVDLQLLASSLVTRCDLLTDDAKLRSAFHNLNRK